MPVIPSTDTLNNIFKNYGNFSVVRTFNNTVPDIANDVPLSQDFVELSLVGDDNINRLEVYADNLIFTNAPTSVVIGLWVKVNEENPYLLGTFGATIGENRATVTENKAFFSLAPILMELQRKGTVKVACRVIVDPTRISYQVNAASTAASESTVLTANTGLVNTLCLTSSSGLGGPPGLGGSIASYGSNSSVTVENLSPIVGESLRLPWGAIPALYFPPLGLSGKVICSDIDRENNRIRIVGSAFDFRAITNRIVRIRLSSIASTISVFPSVDGAVMGNATSYYLLSVTGSPGDQTCQISTNGITPLTFTSLGTGWFYLFPYKDIEGISINGSNQLTLNGNVITLQNDWQNQPVAVTTAGTASVVTHTAHGFVANDLVRMAGTTAPGGATLGDVFFVIPIDANSYKLSVVSNGLPVVFTGAGTAVTIQKVGAATISAVTVSVGTASVIHFGSSSTTTTFHGMGALQDFTLAGTTLAGTTLPGAAYTYSTLTVGATAIASNIFQCVQRRNAPAVAVETAGTSVTLTCALKFGRMLIEKATVMAGSSGDNDAVVTLKNSDNSALAITGVSTNITAIQPINQPVITSGTIKVRAIGGT